MIDSVFSSILLTRLDVSIVTVLFVLSGISCFSYGLQPSLGIVINMLTRLTCSCVGLLDKIGSQHSYSNVFRVSVCFLHVTRLGVSIVTVTFELVVSVCVPFVLQTSLGLAFSEGLKNI